MFGKPVKGHVTVTFGLIWHGHVFTLGKKRNLEVIIIILVHDCLKASNPFLTVHVRLKVL